MKPLGLTLVRPAQILGAEPYFHELIAGIEEITLPVGVSVLLRVLPSHADELDLLRRWSEKQMLSGVFLVDIEEGDQRPSLMRDLGMPTVVVGPPDDDDLMTVWTDDDQAMRAAVDFLASRGRSSILHVGGPETMRHSNFRRSAFIDRCSELGITWSVATGDYSRASGHECAREALLARDGEIAAVFDSDLMALGGLDAARELGVVVPADFTLIAWEDSTQAQLSTPALSTMSRDSRAVGRQLGQAMLDVIEHGEQGVRHASAPTIIERASTPPL